MATPVDGFRGLTNGEMKMLIRLFGASIPYRAVKIYNRKWMKLQSDSRAVAPDGNLYIPPGTWFEEDFSTISDLSRKHKFVHEMVHVWQYHRSGLLSMAVRGIPSLFNKGYDYELDQKKTLTDYSLEAQANILADFYFMQFENTIICSQEKGACGTLAEYRQVLKDFLANPSDPGNLKKQSPNNPFLDHHH
ncbi:MAG: hypothetical protein LBE22_01080 [Azoarcus sp.]|nr:hypothetical protein [Azoarcus sp.]